MTDCLKSNAEKVRLRINTSKTKTERIGNWNSKTTSIKVDERLLEQVSDGYQTLAAIRTLMAILR